MKSVSLLAIVFLFLSVGQAKTLLVSDVDDTIKLANVLDLSSAASYSFDEKSRFLGMSELFDLIKKDTSDLSIYYVSRAPAWWWRKPIIIFCATETSQQEFIFRALI